MSGRPPTTSRDALMTGDPSEPEQGATKGISRNDPSGNVDRSHILATKLFIPSLRLGLVARPRLLMRVEAGLRASLTLLAAPAGWGKTTVISAWCAEAGGDRPVAWVSLDAGDNDPVRFWTYVLTALNTAHRGVADDALQLLRVAQLTAIEAAITLLLNAVAALPADVVLVLDDYHVITAAAIHASLTYLLAHMPPQLHLVIASREDPPLSLARKRAGGSMCELRTADLRFTPEEASVFLAQSTGVSLSAEAVQSLETCTEGWIAGLQLAALSVQGRTGERASEFIAAFGGSNRYIVDYLVEEVLARQPPEVTSFLLRTAVLNRFCAPLCDVLLAHDAAAPARAARGELGTIAGHAGPSAGGSRPHPLSAAALLEGVERANLFLVPLDDERRWYRYHHLFADVLRSRLRQANPGLYTELHRSASAWFERQDLLEEAVGHALAAADFEQAATLLTDKRAVEIVLREGRYETALGWVQALPEPMILSRPHLCITQAMMLTTTYQFDRAEARMRDAEVGIARATLAWQSAHGVSERLPDGLRAMQGRIAILRANRALVTGELDRAVALAREALDLVPESDMTWHAAAEIVLALEYEVTGDVSPAAERRGAAAVLAARAAAVTPTLVLALLAVQGHIQAAQGRLRQGVATFYEAEQLAAPNYYEDIVGFHSCEIGLGEVLRQWNDLDAAERRLLRGVDEQSGHLTLHAGLLTQGYIALARLHAARGEHVRALRTLDHLAETAQRRAFVPVMLEREAAERAQLASAMGDLPAAVRWADTSGLSAEDQELSFRREPANLALVRVRIAQSRGDGGGVFLREAEQLLERLLADAVAKGRGHSVLEILVLRALAQRARRDLRGALGTLARALALAEPEGYVRLFADEGAPMAALLAELVEAAVRQRLSLSPGVLGYARALIAICGSPEGGPPLSMTHAPHDSRPEPTHPAPGVPPLLDPLTERELEVLRLLVEGASNAAIAARLVVTVGTVKKHVHNIYSKLDVQSRMQAVARARALHLL